MTGKGRAPTLFLRMIMCYTKEKQLLNVNTQFVENKCLIYTYQAQEWHSRQAEDNDEDNQTQAAGQNFLAFVLSVSNDGRNNGSTNADTPPNSILLMIRCVPIEDGEEQDTYSQTRKVGANNGIIAECQTEDERNQ